MANLPKRMGSMQLFPMLTLSKDRTRNIRSLLINIKAEDTTFFENTLQCQDDTILAADPSYDAIQQAQYDPILALHLALKAEDNPCLAADNLFSWLAKLKMIQSCQLILLLPWLSKLKMIQSCQLIPLLTCLSKLKMMRS